MRIAIIGLLIIFIGLISYQNISFYQEWREVRAEHAALKAKLESVKDDNARVEDDIGYYQNEENIEKEIRAQLNYKKPGEKLIIVIPQEQ